MSATIRSLLLMGGLAAGLVLLSGCDTTIDPFASETGQFSVYGWLDLDEDRNYIRIKDLTQPLTQEATQELDATVLFENMETGATETLDAELVSFGEVTVYNYWTETPIDYETTYRLTVERSDGAATVTEATTPPFVEPIVQRTGEDCLSPVEVAFPGEPLARLVDVEVGFHYWGELETFPVRTEPNSDGQASVTFVPENILSNRISSQNDPDTFIYETRCAVMSDPELVVRYIHKGPDWMHVNLPLDPLESWGVTNGLGFFGAIRRGSVTVPFDRSNVDEWR